MCGNRVEELESRVQELEASVEGLTDELVECKVRLREMETAVDGDRGFENEESDEPTEESSLGLTTSSGGDASGADTSKPEGTKTDDNQEESEADGGSDIIVA